MKKRSIKLDKIRIDGDTQPRAGINKTLVTEYAEAYESGCGLPPLVVFFDGVDHWLADGFHRWHAVNKQNTKSIICEVIDGTVDDARWYSYAANQTHGQRRSNDDKAKAVKSALLHPNGAGMSDSQIAEYVGVNHSTVAKYRAELEASCEISKIEKRSVKRGEQEYEIDTANIGNRSKPAAIEPEPEEELEYDEPDKPEEEPEDNKTKWLRTAALELSVAAGSEDMVAEFLAGLADMARDNEPAVMAAMLENIAEFIRRN